MKHKFVACFECEECGHERTVKMKNKIGSFTQVCSECDEQARFVQTVEPMDIDKFGEELVGR